jgi:hypothetical protein
MYLWNKLFKTHSDDDDDDDDGDNLCNLFSVGRVNKKWSERDSIMWLPTEQPSTLIHELNGFILLDY